MRRQAALVAVLVVLAGCPTAGAPAPAPESTVTPVPVASTPSPTATPPGAGSDVALPPGISHDGVDADRLGLAHLRALSGRSFRKVAVERSSGWQEFFRPSRTVVRVRNASTYYLRTRGEDNRTVYADPRGRFVRREGDGTLVRPDAGERRNATRAFGWPDALEYVNGSASVAVVERNGTRYVRVFVTDPPPTVLGGSTEIRNYTATAYVRPDGFVRSVRAEYDVESGSRTVHVVRRVTYRLSAVDVPALDRTATRTPA